MDKVVPQWVTRHTLNPWEHFLLTSNGKMKPLKDKEIMFPNNKSIMVM